jgi:hypothetical protein
LFYILSETNYFKREREGEGGKERKGKRGRERKRR